MNTAAIKSHPTVQYLGDVLGSLRYLGSCDHCRTQFMSTHDRVVVVYAGTTRQVWCDRCAAQ